MVWCRGVKREHISKFCFDLVRVLWWRRLMSHWMKNLQSDRDIVCSFVHWYSLHLLGLDWGLDLVLALGLDWGLDLVLALGLDWGLDLVLALGLDWGLDLVLALGLGLRGNLFCADCNIVFLLVQNKGILIHRVMYIFCHRHCLLDHQDLMDSQVWTFHSIV